MARRRIEGRQALAELHMRLHARGNLSLRQIAAMSGVSHATVLADVRRGQAELFASIFDADAESTTPGEAVDNHPESTTPSGLVDSGEEVR